MEDNNLNTLKSNDDISDENLEIVTIQLNMVRDIVVNYGYYRDIHQSLDELLFAQKFWIVTCNNCLSIAFITWCKLFGEKNKNEFHISNVARELSIDINDFLSIVYDKFGLNSKALREYASEIIKFRNKYFAHTDRSLMMPVPHFERACLISIDYYKWISDTLLNKYSVFNESELDESLREFFLDIQNLIDDQIKAK